MDQKSESQMSEKTEKNRKFNYLFSKVVAWSLVFIWMGIIFWFSHQPANESSNLSIRVFRLSGQVLNNWQLAALAGFILLFNFFLIWLTRKSTPGWIKWLLLILFLGLCIGVVYTLLYILRPRYSWLNIENLQTWMAHRVIRKGAHFMIYLLLGIIIKNALNVSGIKGFNSFAISIGICMLYALSDEVHQIYVPGRNAAVLDVFIDSFGSLIGIFLYSIVEWLSGRKTPWQAYWNLSARDEQSL